ncbi:MAG TPA: formylglycine-generating enzyme family protein [Anaerolineales bacterium]|nr:formylglycine-generating enzyme family protein [Anaerolineales bacterium]
MATDTSVPFITQTATSTSGTQAGEIRINPQDQAEIIYIPAATFDMGLSNAQSNILASKWNTKPILLEQSQPQHSVSLGAFWIYRTEVSNDMYRQCVKAGRCIAPLQGNSATRSSYYDNENFSNYPVVYVSWQMSQMYCEWAGGSLPTEAQWEYAARGPDGYLYPWGNSSWSSALANVENSNIGDTSPVDAYSAGASSFGVLNMSGNVFEWVFDWYRKDYYKTNTNWSNPMGPENGDIYQGEQLKSIRGGSFYNPIGNSSVGIHDWERGNSSWYNVGFRCAVAYP